MGRVQTVGQNIPSIHRKNIKIVMDKMDIKK